MCKRWVAAVLASACGWGLLLAVVPAPPARGAAPPLTVGVVEFYALTPLGAFPGVAPEVFAAEDLSRLLAGSGTAQVSVVPAATMRHAEGDLHWRAADVLRFARLQELAKAVGADRLVVGLIPELSVDWGSDPQGDSGKGPIIAEANIVVQVFDASAGRLVGETRQFNSFVGGTTGLVVIGVLHGALARSMPGLLRVLGTGGS